MKKIFTKLLSFALAMVMLLSVLPVNAAVPDMAKKGKIRQSSIETLQRLEKEKQEAAEKQKNQRNRLIIEKPDNGDVKASLKTVKSIKLISQPENNKLIENVDGWYDDYDEETGEGIGDFYYVYEDYVHIEGFVFEITFSNGSKREVNLLEDMLDDDIFDYDWEFEDTQYDTAWGIGKHTVKFYFGGKSLSLEFEVIENPIESVALTALPKKQFYKQNVDGYWDDYYDEDKNKFVKYFYYDLDLDGMEITVYYKDGTNEKLIYDSENTDPKLDSYLYCLDSQYDEPWKPGKNTVYLVYANTMVSFEAYVVAPNAEETPVSISVAKHPDKTKLIYNWDGFIADEYYDDYEPGQFVYEYDFDGLELKVVYANGKTEIKSYDEDDDFFDLVYFEDGQEDSTWKKGKNYVTVYYGELSCEIEYEVIDSPVKSIQMITPPSNTKICQYTNGDFYYLSHDVSDSIPEFYYELGIDLLNGLSVLATNTDGTTETFIFNDRYIYDEAWAIEDDQIDKEWGAGKHKVYLNHYGAKLELEYEIVPTDVKSIKIAKQPTNPVVIHERDLESDYVYNPETRGFDLVDSYTYTGAIVKGLELDVTMNNGDTFRYCYDNLDDFEHMFDFVIIGDDQYKKNWSIGENSITASFMGYFFEIPVYVKHDNVEDITVTSMPTNPIPFESRGFYNCEPVFNDEGWFEGFEYGFEYVPSMCDFSGLKMTVEYDDGTKYDYSYDKDGLYINGDYVDIYDMEGDWEPGVNYFMACYLGNEFKIPVTLAESDTDSIKIKKLPDKLDYVQGVDSDDYYYNGETISFYEIDLEGMELEISDKSGNTRTAAFSDGKWSDDSVLFDAGNYYLQQQFFGEFWSFGKQCITIYYQGCTDSFDITVSGGVILGDLNDDGIVTSEDALIALKGSIGLVELSQQQIKNGDVNGDGAITSEDALIILKYSVGLIDVFPIEA